MTRGPPKLATGLTFTGRAAPAKGGQAWCAFLRGTRDVPGRCSYNSAPAER